MKPRKLTARAIAVARDDAVANHVDRMVRETALDQAIRANDGSSRGAKEIVADAEKFLAFLKGSNRRR